MPADTNNGIMFTSPVAVETLSDLETLADKCSNLPTHPRHTIKQHYDRTFAALQSFTFVQYQSGALTPPMDWTDEGVEGAFRYFNPNEEDNPYWQLKIGRLVRGGQAYEFHVFYYHRDDVLASLLLR